MNNLNVAEWIIVGILSVTLFVFLVCGIVLLVKLIGISKKAQEVVEASKDVVDKTGDVVDNVKDMTSVGSLAKGYVREYVGRKLFGDQAEEYEDNEPRRRHTRTHKRHQK